MTRSECWEVLCCAVVALAMMFSIACGRESGNPGLLELREIPEPARLGEMEPEIQELFRSRRVALQEARGEISVDPEKLAVCWADLADVHHAYDDLEGAEIGYRNAQTLAPGDSRWSYLLGHVYLRRGDLDGARQLFEDSLSRNPDDLAALLWLGSLEFDEGRLEEAEATYRRCLDLDPECGAALAGMGRVAMARGDLEVAVEWLEEALPWQPNASPIRYSLGMAYRSMGDHFLAHYHLDKVPSRNRLQVPITFDDPVLNRIEGLQRGVRAHEKRALSAFARGLYGAAAAEFRQAIEADPTIIEPRYNLAFILIRLGRQGAALTELEAIFEIDSRYAPAHLLMGKIQVAAGRPEKARTSFEKAVEIDPRSEQAQLELARHLVNRGKDLAAVPHFDHAIELAPGVAETRVELAMALVRSNRPDRARVVLEEGLRVFPDEPEMSTLLSWLDAGIPVEDLASTGSGTGGGMR